MGRHVPALGGAPARPARSALGAADREAEGHASGAQSPSSEPWAIPRGHSMRVERGVHFTEWTWVSNVWCQRRSREGPGSLSPDSVSPESSGEGLGPSLGHSFLQPGTRARATWPHASVRCGTESRGGRPRGRGLWNFGAAVPATRVGQPGVRLPRIVPRQEGRGPPTCTSSPAGAWPLVPWPPCMALDVGTPAPGANAASSEGDVLEQLISGESSSDTVTQRRSPQRKGRQDQRCAW